MQLQKEQKQYILKSSSAFTLLPMMFVADAEEKKLVLNDPVMDRANRLCKMEASNGRRTFGTENERNR